MTFSVETKKKRLKFNIQTNMSEFLIYINSELSTTSFKQRIKFDRKEFSKNTKIL